METPSLYVTPTGPTYCRGLNNYKHYGPIFLIPYKYQILQIRLKRIFVFIQAPTVPSDKNQKTLSRGTLRAAGRGLEA